MIRVRLPIAGLLSVMTLVLLPQAGVAYVGPGVGLTVIGAALAAVAGIFLAIVGFVWYPIKRLLSALRARTGRSSVPADDTV